MCEGSRCCRSLNGLGVLVTRPEQQAGPLCQLIEQHGGIAIRCPTLLIAEPHDWTPALAIFNRLADYDLAIFTSVNAVDRALPRIQERGGFPTRLELAAIGRATARALERYGVTHCAPNRASPAKRCWRCRAFRTSLASAWSSYVVKVVGSCWLRH